MAVSLSEMLSNNTIEYYSDGFRKVVEDHLPYIYSSDSGDINIDPASTIRYRGNFFGLLNSLGIHRDLHWPAMRLNGLDSPYDYVETMTIVKIPDAQALSKLHQKWRSSRAK